jgi:hypothetical protein
VIRFKDQQSTDVARENSEWLEAPGNSTKLVNVIVNHISTEKFSVPDNQKDSIRRIMEENDLITKGFHIKEITWLIRPDKPLGIHTSIEIWLDIADAAE